MSIKVKSIILIALFCIATADIVFLNADTTAACPKVTCETAEGEGKQCYIVEGAYSEGKRTATLNQCAEGNYCPATSIAIILEGTGTSKEVCKKNPEPTDPVKDQKDRYPGEDCDEGDDAIHTCDTYVNYWEEDAAATPKTPTCTAGKCTGSAEGKRCDANSSCVVGLYCKIETEVTKNTCVKQLEDGAECDYTNQCSNKSVCSKGKCVEAYSLDVGAEADVSSACKSGIRTTGNKCANYAYDTATHENVSGGWVECDIGSTCKYRLYDDAEKKQEGGVSTQKCVCSYGGKGYCPQATDENEEATKGAKEAIAEDRHTDKRNAGKYDAKVDACATYNPTLFHEADDCVKKVFGYGECTATYVKIAFALFALIAFLF